MTVRSPPAPPASSAVSAAAPREGWVDAARGLTMLLVVLMHANVMVELVGARSAVLHAATHALTPLRMPLFFLLAGMLGARMLARPAATVLRARVLHYVWVWTVWIVLHYALFGGLVLPALGLDPGELFAPRLDPVDHVLVNSSWSWFLSALALYFALALATRRLPAAARLALAALLALPALFDLGKQAGVPVLDRLYHLPFFMAGVAGAGWLRARVPGLARPWRLAPLVLAWGAASAVAWKLEWFALPWVRLLLAPAAIAAGLGFAALVGEWRLAAPLRAVGRATLAIYLLHAPLLRLLVELLPPAATADPAAALAATLALVVAATAIAMLLGRWLAGVPGLFGLPGAAPADPGGRPGAVSPA